jgi:alkylhydroperoxidase/carboxymuconolactone decarboxylase family protein YurZ
MRSLLCAGQQLALGMTPAEIVGVKEHAATLAGLPRAQSALTTAAGVFSQRGVSGSLS